MRQSKPGLQWGSSALAAIAATLCSLLTARADILVNNFNSASEIAQWRFDFGSAAHVESWDSTTDANGNPGSGSWKVTLTFNTALGGENKAAYTTDRWFPGLNGSTLANLQFDLKIDPASSPDAFGNNGSFSMAIRNTDNYNFVQQFGDNVRSADGWRHITISPLIGPYDHIRALTWQLYGGPSQNINGPVTLWLDNIQFAEVPEPGALALFGVGAIALLRRVRRSALPV